MTPDTIYLFDALLRIEKKLDEVLRLGLIKAEGGFPLPLSNPKQVCPLCRNTVRYFEVSPGVHGRVCKCEITTEE